MTNKEQGTARGPWRSLSKQQHYDNPWITVSHEQVITPAGEPGIYGTIHFKNIAVGILPIDQEGNTWLVKQYRYPLQAYSLEIPEGGCPTGESPLEAAQRELQEETGLHATHWRELLQLHLSNSVSDERAIVFIAEGLSLGESSPEGTEDIEVLKLPLQEAIQKVFNGEITDAISVAALLKMHSA